MNIKRVISCAAIALSFAGGTSLMPTAASAASAPSTGTVSNKLPRVAQLDNKANAGIVEFVIDKITNGKASNHNGVYDGPEIKYVKAMKKSAGFKDHSGVIGNPAWNILKARYAKKTRCQSPCFTKSGPALPEAGVIIIDKIDGTAEVEVALRFKCRPYSVISLRIAGQEQALNSDHNCVTGGEFTTVYVKEDAFGHGTRAAFAKWIDVATPTTSSSATWFSVTV